MKCPNCQLALDPSAVEREEGYCPECGYPVTASSMDVKDLNDEIFDEYEDNEDIFDDEDDEFDKDLFNDLEDTVSDDDEDFDFSDDEDDIFADDLDEEEDDYE